MRKSNFRDLHVWEKSKKLCPLLYQLTSSFPNDEKFGVVSQIRRAAISVSINIAEGHGRSSDADFVRFLYISLGSVREIEALLEVSLELGFVNDCKVPLEQLEEVAKMLTGLIRTLKADG